MNNIVSTASINSKAKTPDSFVKLSEENYTAYISDAADMVIGSKKPIVLLSGPSGSGKTSAALRLEHRLEELGATAHTLSMDNYFLSVTPENEKDLPIDENGEVDLESPLRLDIPLFTEHLKKIAACEEFEIPRFDFKTQSRLSGTTFSRKHGEIIIIEGIHALNPMVTGDTHKFATCMYVSVRTRIKTAAGEFIHPRQIRLMRRLCRDRLFRKREYADILKMFASVSRGEDLYIMPHKARSEYDIDTFMPYEASVYKKYLLEDLKQLSPETSEKYPSCADIISVLSELDSISTECVPDTSMLREFIGGSKFSY